MRISDWSSDVCSSDLLLPFQPSLRPRLLRPRWHQTMPSLPHQVPTPCMPHSHGVLVHCRSQISVLSRQRQYSDASRSGLTTARKRDVEGKSVTVRVDLGGRRNIKKKKKKQTKR